MKKLYIITAILSVSMVHTSEQSILAAKNSCLANISTTLSECQHDNEVANCIGSNCQERCDEQLRVGKEESLLSSTGPRTPVRANYSKSEEERMTQLHKIVQQAEELYISLRKELSEFVRSSNMRR